VCFPCSVKSSKRKKVVMNYNGGTPRIPDAGEVDTDDGVYRDVR
jgi:hypothetical protein